jgi:prepilin-type N-terminal cleavage/methylation domain-containing protein
MNLHLTIHNRWQRGTMSARRGFTLVELLIAITIFMVVVGGILAANLLGLRMMQANSNTLAATEWSRKTFGTITSEIHSCNIAYVGTITNGQFAGLLPGEPRIGTSLLIYPTTNSTNYILYYLNPADNTFRRTTDQNDTVTNLADSVTNLNIFTAQDYLGNTLSNNSVNQVIHVLLQIYQPEHYLSAPDFYQLETSVSPRAPQ